MTAHEPDADEPEAVQNFVHDGVECRVTMLTGADHETATTTYAVPGSKVFHLDKRCMALQRSRVTIRGETIVNIKARTLEWALTNPAPPTSPCQACTPGMAEVLRIAQTDSDVDPEEAVEA